MVVVMDKIAHINPRNTWSMCHIQHITHLNWLPAFQILQHLQSNTSTKQLSVFTEVTKLAFLTTLKLQFRYSYIKNMLSGNVISYERHMYVWMGLHFKEEIFNINNTILWKQLSNLFSSKISSGRYTMKESILALKWIKIDCVPIKNELAEC